MPTFNANGEFCCGKAGSGSYWGTISSNDSIRQNLIVAMSGDAAWLNDDEVIMQRWDLDKGARVEAVNIRNGTSRPIKSFGTTDITTSRKGDWAVFSASTGVFDSFGTSFPAAYLNYSCMGPDGSYCMKDVYQSGGGWSVMHRNGLKTRLTAGEASQIVNYGGGITWVENGVCQATQGVELPKPLISPFWWMRLFYVDGKAWQLYQTEKGLYFHPINDTKGHLIEGTNFFYPDITRLSDGRVRIIYSVDQGDTQVRVWTHDPYADLVDLAAAPPVTTGETMIPAFEKPMWMAPYYSFHTRYGDTDLAKYTGNCILQLADDTNQARFSTFGLPLIVDKACPNPDLNLTIAWYVGTGSLTDLVNAVNDALKLAEKPVIAYLDGINWPVDNPFNSDRVWPAIQAYRPAGESLDMFNRAITSALDVVTKYGLPLCLTPRFDDFNGSQTIQAILECMPLYEQWIRAYPIVAIMPFADRRGNGISKVPDFYNWAHAFHYALPAGRPNRFDYWKPAGQDNETILKNKFGQSRTAIVLEQYLRDDILKHYDVSPTPPPSQVWPNHLDTVQQVRAKYPATVTADQCTAIVNEVAWIHRNEGFGCLKKTGGNHGLQPGTNIPCSTDWCVSNVYNLGTDCLGSTGSSETGVPGPGTAQWGDGQPFDINNWVAPVQP